MARGWLPRIGGTVALLLAGGMLFGLPVSGTAGDAGMDLPSMGGLVSSWHRYTVPPIALTDQHGQAVDLAKVLSGTRPVLVQFFFSTCTTICDVRSAQLVAIAPQLARADIRMAFYTISIDPDHDTPGRLLAYSKHFGTPPANWHLLTGSMDQIRQVQAAFDASDPSADKMMHQPLTFLRGGTGRPWLRIDGTTDARELVRLIKATISTAG